MDLVLATGQAQALAASTSSANGHSRATLAEPVEAPSESPLRFDKLSERHSMETLAEPVEAPS
jgi:hypothetical protein